MILIDYSAIAISNVIVGGLDIEENLIRHMILNSLRMYRTKFKQKYGELVICCDAHGNWRKQMFPQYKAARAGAREDSKIDWDQLFVIIEKVKSELREFFPYKVIQITGCEADDIIGQLVFNTQEFGNYEEVMIVSSDKDFAQLQVFSNVEQYSPMKKGFIKEPDPKGFLLDHILTGDKSDGVPNVLSDDNVFVDGRRQVPLTKKKRASLIDSNGSLICEDQQVFKNIIRNTKLIDLSKTPKALKEEIINNFNNESLDNRGDRSKVMRYLMDNQCRNLLEKVEEFIQ